MTSNFETPFHKKTDPDPLMVTFDITNIYSNITCKFGKQAITFCIEKYSETLHPRFNKKFITDGIELILSNNSFQFDNINSILTQGTAMGTKMATMYSTLTLAYLEENLYEISSTLAGRICSIVSNKIFQNYV